jgi:hypothetical protein
MLVLSGAVLLAGAVLLLLQVANHADFSLYGKNLSVRQLADGSTSGGVNTALLMLFSAVGGIVCVYLAKLFFAGLRNLAAARRATAAREKQP